MMILIVEDDESKAKQLHECARSLLPDADIRISRSLRSGLQVATEEVLSLILLDMTIPTYDVRPGEIGGKPQNFGGKEFLAQMERFDIRVPVVLVTQFETFGQGRDRIGLGELDEQLRAEFGEVYRGAVYYQAAVEGWKSKLAEAVHEIF